MQIYQKNIDTTFAKQALVNKSFYVKKVQYTNSTQ